MKTLTVLIMLFVLAGCVSIKYSKSPTEETLEVVSVLKKTKGLTSLRDENGFFLSTTETDVADISTAINAMKDKE